METPDPRLEPDPEPVDVGLWTSWPRRHVLALAILLMASNVMVQFVVFGLGLGLFWSVLAGALLGVLAPLAFIGRANPARLRADLGLDLPDLRILAASAVMVLCALLPTSRLAELSMRLHPPEPGWEGFMLEQLPDTTGELVLAVITVIVVAPLVEEIIFRGLLQKLAALAWGAVPGMVIAALVFAVVHNEAWFLFGLIGVGLVLGYIFHVTGSVTAAWAAHAVHNTVSLGMMVAAGDAAGEPSPLTLQDAGWLLLSVLGMVLAGGYLLVRARAGGAPPAT